MSPRHPPAPLIETLDPRILYSADLMPVAAAGEPLAGEQQLIDQPAPATTQNALLVIDTRIADYQRLQAAFTAQLAAQEQQVDVLLIDDDEDGIARLSAALAERQDLSAVHLVTHGAAGAIQLGSSSLDSNALLARAPEIAAWGSALSADGDILIYGCEVAEGSAGRQFIDQLAALTGADVAGSENLTGEAAQGGDWLLEYRHGTVEAVVAFSAYGLPGWQGVLATYTVTNTSDSGAGSLRQAITNANGNAGTDTIDFNIAGTGTHTITLASALPLITDTVILDATTDDSFATNGNRPAIILNAGGASNGLALSNADNSTIRGLAIRNFGTIGISVDANTSGATIAGNYIGNVGTDGNYSAGPGFGTGIWVMGANNTIGGTSGADRNVIGTTSNTGVRLQGASATGNTVQGNYLGVNAAGTAAFTVNGIGIQDYQTAGGNFILDNVMASPDYFGVTIFGTTTQNTISGNTIGIRPDGSCTRRR